MERLKQLMYQRIDNNPFFTEIDKQWAKAMVDESIAEYLQEKENQKERLKNKASR